MIEIKDLAKSFGELRVLEQVDLTIQDGESVVVLGRSGTGKSVLLKHIIGLLMPDRGSIKVDGDEVTAMSYNELAELRRRFGMVFQMAALFDSMTVQENIGLSLREHTKKKDEEIREIVRAKLELVGLPGIEEKKPADLSGGMRKRVGLARAIAMDPQYILYDEPTAGLDPVTSDQISKLIRSLQKQLKVTAIVVTHDMNNAFEVGDRLCLLHKGRIHFDGTPDEIRATDDPVVQQFIQGESTGPIAEAVERLEGQARRSGRA